MNSSPSIRALPSEAVNGGYACLIAASRWFTPNALNKFTESPRDNPKPNADDSLRRMRHACRPFMALASSPTPEAGCLLDQALRTSIGAPLPSLTRFCAGPSPPTFRSRSLQNSS
jgi:hypothetical protein